MTINSNSRGVPGKLGMQGPDAEIYNISPLILFAFLNPEIFSDVTDPNQRRTRILKILWETFSRINPQISKEKAWKAFEQQYSALINAEFPGQPEQSAEANQSDAYEHLKIWVRDTFADLFPDIALQKEFFLIIKKEMSLEYMHCCTQYSVAKFLSFLMSSGASPSINMRRHFIKILSDINTAITFQGVLLAMIRIKNAEEA